jgi:hypothetical protein
MGIYGQLKSNPLVASAVELQISKTVPYIEFTNGIEIVTSISKIIADMIQ